MPRKVSSIFKGWFEYDSSEPFDVIPDNYSGDLKVYAKWQQAEVYNDLTFHTNGGILASTAPTEYKEGVSDFIVYQKKKKDGTYKKIGTQSIKKKYQDKPVG